MPAPEPSAGETRIRSIKVTTYDVPATVVGVMAEAPQPDWDVAALPMIVRRAPRRVTKVEPAETVAPTEEPEPAEAVEPAETIAPAETVAADRPAQPIQAGASRPK